MVLMNIFPWYKYGNVGEGVVECYNNINIQSRLVLTKEEFQNHSREWIDELLSTSDIDCLAIS